MLAKKPVATRNIDGIIRPQTTGKKQSLRFSRRLIAVVATIAVLSGITGAVIHFTSRPTGSEVEVVMDAVSRHYVLPANEQPALATVTDKDKVSAAFRGKADNGDRILIYQKNAQAIVYRQSIDKIVAVVPVTIDTPQTGQASQ